MPLWYQADHYILRASEVLLIPIGYFIQQATRQRDAYAKRMKWNGHHDSDPESLQIGTHPQQKPKHFWASQHVTQNRETLIEYQDTQINPLP